MKPRGDNFGSAWDKLLLMAVYIRFILEIYASYCTVIVPTRLLAFPYTSAKTRLIKGQVLEPYLHVRKREKRRLSAV
jgi:hypothetical protein